VTTFSVCLVPSDLPILEADYSLFQLGRGSGRAVWIGYN